jgi:hypothetical protein
MIIMQETEQMEQLRSEVQGLKSGVISCQQVIQGETHNILFNIRTIFLIYLKDNFLVTK